MEDKKMQLIMGKSVEQFRPIFEWIKKRELGKFTGTYCLIRTDMTLQPANETYELFNKLQEEAFHKGFLNNCFCL